MKKITFWSRCNNLPCYVNAVVIAETKKYYLVVSEDTQKDYIVRKSTFTDIECE